MIGTFDEICMWRVLNHRTTLRSTGILLDHIDGNYRVSSVLVVAGYPGDTTLVGARRFTPKSILERTFSDDIRRYGCRTRGSLLLGITGTQSWAAWIMGIVP